MSIFELVVCDKRIPLKAMNLPKERECNLYNNPKPLQEPYPTITIGSSGEKYLLKVVAKHADRYNHPCGSVELLKRKISKLKEHCTTIGRNPKEIQYSIFVSCLVGI